MPSNKWKKFKKNAKNKKAKPPLTVEEAWAEASRKLRESPILGVPHTSDRSLLRARLYEVLNITPSPEKSDGVDGDSSQNKNVGLSSGTSIRRSIFQQDENSENNNDCASIDAVNEAGIADDIHSPLKKKSKISFNQEELVKNRSEKSLNISKLPQINFKSSDHTTLGLGQPSVLPAQSPTRNVFPATNEGVVSGFKISNSDFKKQFEGEKTRHNNDSRDLFDEWSDDNSAIAEKIQPFSCRSTNPRQMTSSRRSQNEHSESSYCIENKSLRDNQSRENEMLKKLKFSNCNSLLVTENGPKEDYSQPSTSGIKQNVLFTYGPSKDKPFPVKRNDSNETIIRSSNSNCFSSSFNSDVPVAPKGIKFADKSQTIKDIKKVQSKICSSENDRVKIGTIATEEEIEMVNAIIHETCETKVAVSYGELKKFKRHCAENGRNDLWLIFKSTDKYKIILSLIKYGELGKKRTQKSSERE